MIDVAILGATGYTAVELLKILLKHPHVRIAALTSREDTRPVDQVHRSLAGRLNLSLENLSPAEVASRAGCVFSCLPHCASASIASELLGAGATVIDFSADYRLDGAAVFQKWYATEHPDPARLGSVPYGLPELFRKEISGSKLIANPGCYPTSAILPVAPLLKAGLVEPTEIILDSKSGVSGAGRKPALGTLYAECNESFSAYGVGTHRHTPEIDRILTLFGGRATNVIFTPHLVPMDRGILTTAYLKPTKDTIGQAEVLDALRRFYANEPFVRIVDHLPATKDVSGTNFTHIAVRRVGDRILTISVIDNLVKGASGAAAQNFNVLYGFEETLALV